MDKLEKFSELMLADLEEEKKLREKYGDNFAEIINEQIETKSIIEYEDMTELQQMMIDDCHDYDIIPPEVSANTEKFIEWCNSIHDLMFKSKNREKFVVDFSDEFPLKETLDLDDLLDYHMNKLDLKHIKY